MFFKYILPSIAWAIFILILCGIPPQHVDGFSFWEILNPDKIFHFGVFALLSLFLIVGFKRQYSFPKLRCNAVLSAVLTSSIYGVLIELTQILFFHGREGDWLDILANTLGAVSGIILFRIIYGNTILRAS